MGQLLRFAWIEAQCCLFAVLCFAGLGLVRLVPVSIDPAGALLLCCLAARTGLQDLTITAGLPFALVMVGLAVSPAKDVRTDPMVLRRTYPTEAVEQAVVDGLNRHGDAFVLVVKSAEHSGGPAGSVRTAPGPADRAPGRDDPGRGRGPRDEGSRGPRRVGPPGSGAGQRLSGVRRP